MISVRITKLKAFKNLQPQVAIAAEIPRFGRELTGEMDASFKQSIRFLGAVSSLKLLKSVRSEIKAGDGVWKSTIMAARHWIFVQKGRRAGAKMPPEEALRAWFELNNIPKHLWFPIRRAIARRGIAPRDIQGLAVHRFRSKVSVHISSFARRAVKRMFEK